MRPGIEHVPFVDPWFAVYTVAVMSPRRRFCGCGSEKHGMGLRIVFPFTVCVLSQVGIAVFPGSRGSSRTSRETPAS